MLKGHLQAAYGLTLVQYRKRWGLPPNYPMVAPNYARQRSAMAKAIGLRARRTNSQLALPTPPSQPMARPRLATLRREPPDVT